MVCHDLSVFDDERFSQVFTQIIMDVMAGGFDSSATTSSWGVLYLIQKPEVAQKCRAELLKLIGEEESDCLADVDVVKKRCPYFMATVYEILRKSTVGPLGLLHQTTCDTSLQGYPVSKGTVVISNIHQINHDPDEWSEPEEFRPERFLIEIESLDPDNQQSDSKASKTNLERPNNQSLTLNQKACNEVANFSSGLRRCPGDKIALSMLCILLGTLIRRYDFEVVKAPEDMVPIKGFLLKPKHYLIKLNKV